MAKVIISGFKRFQTDGVNFSTVGAQGWDGETTLWHLCEDSEVEEKQWDCAGSMRLL